LGPIKTNFGPTYFDKEKSGSGNSNLLICCV